MDKIPNIPVLTLIPQPPSEDSYLFYRSRKHLMLLNDEPEYDNTKIEIDKKYKHLFDKQQALATTETQSTGDIYINITLYILCQRCERWILKTQQEMHLSCHTAIVMDNLLLGDNVCSQSYKQLVQRNQVTHIVNAAVELPNHLESKGLKYLKLSLSDNMTEELLSEVIRAVQFIKTAHREGGKVFVHCQMGKSRSVAVILVYLMRQHSMSFQQALDFIRKVRPIAKPNPNYMNQLKQYEQKLFKVLKKQKQQQ